MKKGSGVIGCIVHGHSIAELANSVSNVCVLITYSKVTYYLLINIYYSRESLRLVHFRLNAYKFNNQ